MIHIFFLCAYAFSSAKIHLSQNLNSSPRKTLILFVKTVPFCAAHKRMKRHMRKKIRITSFFCAPMRFQVQRFSSLNLNSSLTKLKFISQKNFDFISQNRAFLRRAQTHENTHEKKKLDHMFFPCAYAFSSAKIHVIHFSEKL